MATLVIMIPSIFHFGSFLLQSRHLMGNSQGLPKQITGAMAASEIPPQMANFQSFSLKDLFFLSGGFFETLHTAILC